MNLTNYQASKNLLSEFETTLQHRVLELERKVKETTNVKDERSLKELLFLNTYLYKFLFVGLH